MMWYNVENGDFVGTFHAEPDEHEEPTCPRCGKRTEYWEGQIDQDRMGNDIHGYNYVCYPCQIETGLCEID